MTSEAEAFERGFENDGYPACFLEKYRTVKCLSRGENGETLIVEGRVDNELYVAKILPACMGGESDIICGLKHPALPRFVESFEAEGAHISVREYVDGMPLSEAVNGRALSTAETECIGAQLCDVLTYLHTQTPPVIHRDVKPQNVILCEDGGIKLIDFGISRRYRQNAEKDTVFSGTNDFAPPEQYGFAQTDARADIYSLGMLLKYLATGGAQDGGIADRRLRRIIARCTAFSPKSRYASAARVKRALMADSPRRLKRVAAALAIAMLTAGVLIGRFALPFAEERIAAARAVAIGTAAEYSRAAEYGFIPETLADASPDGTVVTWGEYCAMLGSMIAKYDGALLPRWNKMTANAPDTPMKRDGGMMSLLFAAELMGLDSFNAAEPEGFYEYSPKVWQNVTMDYPVFDFMQPKKITEDCYDDNYVGPSYDFCLRRLSKVTGKPLLEFDKKGDFRLSEPFTLREAVQAVIRLYESAD